MIITMEKQKHITHKLASKNQTKNILNITNAHEIIYTSSAMLVSVYSGNNRVVLNISALALIVTV